MIILELTTKGLRMLRIILILMSLFIYTSVQATEYEQHLPSLIKWVNENTKYEIERRDFLFQ